MRQMNVVLVCTTDDPTDTLEHHAAHRGRHVASRSACCPPSGPTRRWPSSARRPSTPGSTGSAAAAGHRDRGTSTTSSRRSASAHDFFHAARLPALRPRPRDAVRRGLHRDARCGASSRRPAAGADADARGGAEVQVGACSSSSAVHGRRAEAGRSSSTSAPCGTTTRGCFAALGPDTGFDSIGDFAGRPAARRASSTGWTAKGRLPKTILYNLNPARQRRAGHDDRQLPGRLVARQDAVRQRLVVPRPEGRHGAAARARSSNLGLLSRFVGMLTDRRSLPLLHAARVLPPHPLQPAGRRDGARAAARTTWS